MKICNLFVECLRQKLPELASVKDLIDNGIYRSAQAACTARRMGKCPPYIHIPQRGIVYPREGVIEFLEKNSHEG